MKRFLLLLLSAMLVFASCIDTKSVFAADDSAYAVLTDSGELIFFRSTNEYEDATEYDSVIDVDNNNYKGVVFNGVEDSKHSWINEEYKDSILSVKVAEGQIIKPTRTVEWFYGCSNLAMFDSSGFDTSRVTSMISMFRDCKSLKQLDLKSFDTSNVTNVDAMFYGCSSLSELNISSFSTPNLTGMDAVFYDCSSLNMLDLSNFNTSSVKQMGSLFRNCSSLKTLDLSNFNTAKVENFGSMFNGCSSLVTLNIDNFDTSSSNNMKGMFDNCSAIESITLSKYMTKWTHESYLPEGNWHNDDIYKTEKELYKEYPSNAEAWAGAWTKINVEYKLLERSNDNWERDSTETLDFRFGRNFLDELTFNSFDSIKIDGFIIENDYFTTESGSITIKLNPDYLNTLTSGEHTLTASFTDGDDVETKFSIIDNKKDSEDENKKQEENDNKQETITYLIPKTGIE